MDASLCGANVGIPPLRYWVSNRCRDPGGDNVRRGSLTRAVALRKGVSEALRGSPQDGWKPSKECKGIRELDCDTDGWSRYESRT